MAHFPTLAEELEDKKILIDWDSNNVQWIYQIFDGVGPANMSGDLPSKKSQLDLRLFCVGVLVVGCMISPWPRLQTKESKMSLLVARV